MSIARSALSGTFSAVFSLVILAGAAIAGAETHEVKKADARATVGVKGKASVTITGKNGWKVNEEAPLTLKLAPDSGVTVDKPKLTRADAAQRTKEMARFDVGFTATEPGKKAINCEASFVMCIDTKKT
jgi:hypothetical protein